MTTTRTSKLRRLSDDDLRRLYVDEGKSAKFIARMCSVKVGVVSARLDMIGLRRSWKESVALAGAYVPDPEGLNADNPLKNTACPVSLLKLRHLYEVELRSQPQIAALLHANVETVARWMRLAGIQIRDASTRSRIDYYGRPVDSRPSGNRGPGNRGPQTPEGIARAKRALKRGKTTQRKTCEARRVHLVCSHPNCSLGENGKRRNFSKRPSTVRPWNYCCADCARADQSRRQSELCKSRLSRGQYSCRTRLNERDVCEMRRLHSSGVRQKDLAEMFRVSRSQTSLIVNNKAWMFPTIEPTEESEINSVISRNPDLAQYLGISGDGK